MKHVVVIDEVTYIPTENPISKATGICDACVLYIAPNICRLDEIKGSPNCEIHHTEIYKVSLKGKLQSL